MATSTGRQARLRNLYRNVADTGLRERRVVDGELIPAALVLVDVRNASCSSILLSESLSSSGGGEETNKSLSFRLARTSFSFFSGIKLWLSSWSWSWSSRS
uniref:Uncharacterized protein n=1 Tax=Cucumis sativus TaxID=3659 RepID=A0A0A0LMV2_CUCSA